MIKQIACYESKTMCTSNVKSFIIDGSERSVQDTVAKLKFISKIGEGEVMDVHSLTLSEIGYFTSVYRTFFGRGESRENTLDFFRRTIQDAFDLAMECFSKEDAFFKNTGAMVITSIRECKIGIENHAKTYASDRMHAAKIDTLLMSVEARLKDIMLKINENGDIVR